MAINVATKYLAQNLTRLRAISYKLAVMKYRVDSIITRLERKQYGRHLDHDDFRHDHVQHLDTYTGRLAEQVMDALKEVKGSKPW